MYYNTRSMHTRHQSAEETVACEAFDDDAKSTTTTTTPMAERIRQRKKNARKMETISRITQEMCTWRLSSVVCSAVSFSAFVFFLKMCKDAECVAICVRRLC